MVPDGPSAPAAVARAALPAALAAACLLGGCDGGRAAAPPAPQASPTGSSPPSDAALGPDAIAESLGAAGKALDDGRIDDARTIAEYLAARAAGPEGQELLGRVRLTEATLEERAGRFDRAREARAAAAVAYRAAAERDAGNAALQDAAAMVIDSAGDVEAAAPLYDRAVAGEPRNVGFRLHRANALLRRGRAAEARADAEAALAIAPQEAWGHALRAEAAEALGDRPTARAAVAEARRLAPSEIAFRVLAARLLRLDGRTSDAVELLLALDEPTRASITVAAELADGWNALGKPDRAATTWEAAYRAAIARRGPLSERLRTAVAAGQARLAEGNRIAASSWLDIARLLAPEDPSVAALAAAFGSPATDHAPPTSGAR